MTYKELYLKEHPECKDIDRVIKYGCPGAHMSVRPPRCIPGDTSVVCPICWNQEIPEEKSDIQNTVEQLKEALDPVGTAAAKGGEALKKLSNKMSESCPFCDENAQKKAFEKLISIPSLKIGDQDELKNIENDEKVKALETANNIDGTVNKVIIEPKFTLSKKCEKLQLDWYKAIGVAGETAKKASEALAKTTSAILDSGTRREFATGAVRDIQEGKGRCDLLPLDVLAEHMEDSILLFIHQFTTNGNHGHLYRVLDECPSRLNMVVRPTVYLEVAKHFEAGAAKYGEYNWQKGIPTHCYIDSAVRHYLKFLRGDKDEAHDRAFVWNILCCIWTCKHKPELNDYPRKEKTDEQL